MLAGNRCTVIGDHANALVDNCLVVGDYETALVEGSVSVGETLFNEPIPEKVKEMILVYPDEFAWLIQVILRNGGKPMFN